jgi:hypothetical protein
MSKKKLIWTIVLVVIAGAAYYGYKEYNRTYKKLDKVKADFTIGADALISEFEAQDSVSYKKYDDKIIEVTGVLKNSSLGDFTILLGDPAKLSAVKCELDTSFRKTTVFPAMGSQVTVKGHFYGFQKEEMMEGVSLGLDVNLNRCVIVNDKK